MTNLYYISLLLGGGLIVMFLWIKARRRSEAETTVALLFSLIIGYYEIVYSMLYFFPKESIGSIYDSLHTKRGFFIDYPKRGIVLYQFVYGGKVYKGAAPMPQAWKGSGRESIGKHYKIVFCSKNPNWHIIDLDAPKDSLPRDSVQ